ncbi:MAG: four-helix bundle copper-binding protein [Hyphomicrobiales bacterium]|nr:MAG: four-helix bundle copper-binding protein [Hyphomicrobiales bacterium]
MASHGSNNETSPGLSRGSIDCWDVCLATGATSTRRIGSNEELIRSMLESYAVACCLCADECEKHAPQHEHYRVCAEACRRCEQACKDALRSLGATH